MAWNLSTGAKKALLGADAEVLVAMTADTISFGDGTGTGGRDQILDSGNGLAVFDDYPYYMMTVSGSTSNDGAYLIKTVAPGAIEIPAGSLTTEIAGNQVILTVQKGGSFCDVFRNCVLDIYSGSRPTTADAIETGTKLCRITLGGGAFVSGSPDNGINFEVDDDGNIVLMEDPATGADQILQGVGLVTGSALFGRLYANTVVTGASTSAVRMDGRVATSGVEINMSSGTTITLGVDADVNSVEMSI